MSISMYNQSVPVFVRGLKALSAILDKTAAHCEAKKIDPAALLTFRLYPDMFHFTKQVQISCDFAKNTAGRLTGNEPPRFEDTEASIADLKARIARTVTFLEGLKATDIDGSETRDIRFSIGSRQMEFKGLAFLQGFGLPNFYFHLTTAYNILRHNGVEIGKRDFLG